MAKGLPDTLSRRIATALVVGGAAALLIAWLRGALERDGDEAPEPAEIAERMRIARELHGSAGDAIAAASIQATTALRAVGEDEDATRDSLYEIQRASKSALADMRRLLGVLRAA